MKTRKSDLEMVLSLFDGSAEIISIHLYRLAHFE